MIILVDEQSKSRLLQNYAAVILPYSRFPCSEFDAFTLLLIIRKTVCYLIPGQAVHNFDDFL